MTTAPIQACWKNIGTWGDRSCPELPAHGHCRNCPVHATGAARLLDVAVGPEYLRAAAKRYSEAKVETRLRARSAVVFRISGEWLALPTSVFQEIAPVRPIHSLPHRRDTLVRGIVNVRGELLVCVSMAAALGLSPAPAAPDGAEKARLAVIGHGAERIVFQAERIAGLHRYDDPELTPVPATLAHSQAVHTRGMLHWQEHSVGLLDEKRILQTVNRGLA